MQESILVYVKTSYVRTTLGIILGSIIKEPIPTESENLNPKPPWGERVD